MNKSSISCVIVDDDAFSRETLEDLLSAIPEVEILKSLDDSRIATKYLAMLKPDVVFLDINMPEKNGISILNEINELGIRSKVIFVTAHHEYLMDALKKNAFDYLIKPVKKQDLDEAIQRLVSTIEKKASASSVEKAVQQSEAKIVIQNSYGSILLAAQKVAYIEADGCYSKLHLTDQKTETISKNIGKIESLFLNDSFFKISRSYIINLHYLNKIDRLRKEIHLFYGDKCIKLKASKNLLYNLESLINTK